MPKKKISTVSADDGEARERGHRNARGIGGRLQPVHGAHDLQVVIEPGADRHDADADEHVVALLQRGGEDEEFSEKAHGERNAREGKHRHQQGEGQARARASRAR